MQANESPTSLQNQLYSYQDTGVLNEYHNFFWPQKKMIENRIIHAGILIIRAQLSETERKDANEKQNI